MSFISRNKDYEKRVRDSFEQQNFMSLIGAQLSKVEPGYVDILLPFSRKLSNQHNSFHGGLAGAVADSAAGYAALSLFDSSSAVVTVEFKLNFLKPGVGEFIEAKGQVLKTGKTLTICKGDIFAIKDQAETLIATGLYTMMCLDQSYQ